MKTIEFWFDFTSPYSYLAATRIDDLAAKHGRTVTWHPFLLGAIFQKTGGQPPLDVPLKGDYSRRDFARSARFLGVPFRFPARFPLPTQAAARAFYWLDAQFPTLAKPFAQAMFTALFVEGRDISAPEVVLDLAAGLGIEREALSAALASPPLKAQLVAVNQAALDKGIFGAPFVIIDGEPFWGADRLPQIEQWLTTGGF